MSIRHADSFQAYAAIGDAEKAGFTVTGSPTIYSVGGRRGGRAMRFHDAAAASTSKIAVPGAAAATIAVCVAALIDDLAEAVTNSGRFLMFYDGATAHVGVGVLADGSIQVYRMTSETAVAATLGTTAAGLITSANYHHIEVQVTIHNSTGAVKVFVDGDPTPALDLTVQDTQNGGTAQITAVAIGLDRYGDVDHMFCDFVIRDGTAQLGDVRVDYLPANANGDTNDFSTNGSAVAFENVDELTPDDVSYNYSNSVGEKDLYGLADVSWSPTTIHAVVQKVRAMKSDAGTRGLVLTALSGGSEFDGSSQVPLTSSKYFHQVVEEDPNTEAPWSEGGVNAYELGAKVA